MYFNADDNDHDVKERGCVKLDKPGALAYAMYLVDKYC